MHQSILRFEIAYVDGQLHGVVYHEKLSSLNLTAIPCRAKPVTTSLASSAMPAGPHTTTVVPPLFCRSSSSSNSARWNRSPIDTATSMWPHFALLLVLVPDLPSNSSTDRTNGSLRTPQKSLIVPSGQRDAFAWFNNGSKAVIPTPPAIKTVFGYTRHRFAVDNGLIVICTGLYDDSTSTRVPLCELEYTSSLDVRPLRRRM
jgi:hypothetical protein